MTSEVNGAAITAPQGSAAAAGRRIALMTLGMHRSGTSALAGVLVRLGCDAPATPMASDMRNTKGFYESRPISALNNVILSSAGTTWDDWTAVNSAWFDSPRRADFAEQAFDLVKSEFGASPLIVLKDPRISLLAPLWFDVLRWAGYEIRVVFAYRSALDVAASLTERNGFDPALGRLLWLRYMLEAERASRDVPRVFVSYDRLLSDWSAEISRIETGLDLRLPRQSPSAREEVEDFLTPSMRHFLDGDLDRGNGAASHPWIHDTQAVFERWTRDGETPSDRKTLDRIRAEFDSASPVFDRLVRVAKGRAGSEVALEARLKESGSALEQGQAIARGDREALVRAEERIGTLEEGQATARGDREALVRAEERIATLGSEIAGRERDAAASEAEIATLRTELERRGEVLLTYEQEVDDLNHALADLSKAQISLQQAFEKAGKAATQTRKNDAAAFEAARKAAKTQKHKSDVALARANSRINRIMNSKSFRLTAPFRHLKSLIAKK